MRFYSTEYVLKSLGKEQKFNSNIWASNFEEACQIALLRNIDEKVIGVVVGYPGFDPCPLPSTFYKTRDLVECAHVLVFYGWIASKAGVSSCDGLLNDHGVIHEVLHELHHPTFYMYRQEIMNHLIHLESQIPGLKTFVRSNQPAKITAQ